MRNLRAIAAGVLVPVVVIALSACGSSKKSAATSSGSGGGTVIEAVDYRFNPKTLTATSGSQVKLTFKNNGTAEHDFSITQVKVDVEAEKGASKNVSFTAPSPGTYEFFCKYHKDSNGMVGTLTVT
jgi:plastocyanin